MNSKLIEELRTEYTGYISDVEVMVTYIDKLENGCPDKRSEYLERVQTILNKLYAIKQAPVLVDVQSIINFYRNEFDITDPTEINDEGFVQ